MNTPFGIVLIGRNEGPRLCASLASLRQIRDVAPLQVVYVDSGSTDDSVQRAREAGADVVQLEVSQGFTAARARNAGARRLLQLAPDVQVLQFIDGDCTIDPRWAVHALQYLHHHSDVAVVCGRRRERFPNATIFNLLCDLEWATPIGNASEFGGDCMMRADIFTRMNGYRETLIAGEEPDLAARIRLAGHRIVRLNHEMTLHDAAMTNPIQWWRRMKRSGHALAELHHLHGCSPLRFYRSQMRSTILWAAIVPAFITLLALLSSFWLLLLLPIAYSYLATRITRHMLNRGEDHAHAILYALSCVIGKIPQLAGVFQFHRNRWANRPSVLIEYKSAPPAIPADAALHTSQS